MREATAKGPAIDLTEFERRLRGPQPSNPRAHDPLKELARLLNGNEAAAPADPYRDVFAEEAPHRELSPYRAEPHMRAPQSQAYYPGRGRFSRRFAWLVGLARPPISAIMRRIIRRPPITLRPENGRSMKAKPISTMARRTTENTPPPMKSPAPDAVFRNFARGTPSPASPYLASSASDGHSAHRSGGSIAPQDLATIAAPEGPAKVSPAASEAPQPEQAATVLDRNEKRSRAQGRDKRRATCRSGGRAKSPALSALAPSTLPHQASSDGLVPAPEPRKVKTVSVRPDGSLIANDAVPPAVVAKPARPAPPAAKVSGSGGSGRWNPQDRRKACDDPAGGEAGSETR